MRLYPIALDLKNRKCVVIGGGKVAERRATSLLEAGGATLVVAPVVTEIIQRQAVAGTLQTLLEPFRADHLEGAFIAVAATNSTEVNRQVVQEAQKRGILVNDAEKPETGDFIVPSVVRRGGLLLTVTTAGASPSLAMQIKTELEARYGDEYADYITLLSEIRNHILDVISDPQARRNALKRVASDPTILPLLQEGRADEARNRAYLCIS